MSITSVYKYTNDSWVKLKAFQATSDGNWNQVSSTTTPITSTVDAFLVDSATNYAYFTTMLGGGNGTYTATTTLGSVSIEGNVLELYVYSAGSGTCTITSGEATLEIPIYVGYIECLVKDTLITMWDRTQKPIQDIRNGDYVLSLNEKGEEVPGYVYYADGDQCKTGQHYDQFTFSDGTVVKVVHRHRFYNNFDRTFTHLDNFYIGDKCYKQDGTWVTLVGKIDRAEEGIIPHYTIFCNNNTYFANGLLCGNRFSKKVKLIDPTIPAEPTYSWQPVARKFPDDFKVSKIWVDSKDKDIYIEKNGQAINYIQTDNNEAKMFLYQYNGEKDYHNITLEELDTNAELVLEITEYDTQYDITNLIYNYILYYEYKIDRISPIATISIENAGGVSTLRWGGSSPLGK